MSLKQRNYAVVVGVPLALPLQQAANEDIQHIFTFVDAPEPLGSGQPIDLTGAASITMTIKDQSGQQLAQVVGAAIGAPTAGKAGFTLMHTPLVGKAAQAYVADVLLIDSAANQNQVLGVTPFLVTAGVT